MVVVSCENEPPPSQRIVNPGVVSGTAHRKLTVAGPVPERGVLLSARTQMDPPVAGCDAIAMTQDPVSDGSGMSMPALVTG